MDDKTAVGFTRMLSPDHYYDRLFVIDLRVLVFVTQFKKGNFDASQTKTKSFKPYKVKSIPLLQHLKLF
jgi:hypothetical protein